MWLGFLILYIFFGFVFWHFVRGDSLYDVTLWPIGLLLTALNAYMTFLQEVNLFDADEENEKFLRDFYKFKKGKDDG